MPSKSVRGRTAGLVAAAVTTTLACNLLAGSSTSPKISEATQAALRIQGTAMILKLTQTALAGRLQQPAAPGAPPTLQTLSTPAETQAVGTATAGPEVVLLPNATEISYGQRLGSYPRKSEGVLYGFKGIKGDVVTIVLVSSNARPNEAACSSVATSSTTFTVQAPGSQLEATNESAHLSSIRDYELPTTGAYYITVSCVGGGCNGHCTEADLSIDKK
jgi:hypothetical protein